MSNLPIQGGITPHNASHTVQEAVELPDRTKETAKQFESVFLTQFVDQMLKTVGSTAFGGEKQADMWRSFLSEAVAETLVEQGGFGIGHSVADVIGAYEKSTRNNES